MRILVTGASGYIGGKLVDALSGKDWVEHIFRVKADKALIKPPDFVGKILQ